MNGIVKFVYVFNILLALCMVVLSCIVLKRVYDLKLKDQRVICILLVVFSSLTIVILLAGYMNGLDGDGVYFGTLACLCFFAFGANICTAVLSLRLSESTTSDSIINKCVTGLEIVSVIIILTSSIGASLSFGVV